jgi:hypothetical protein
MSIIRKRLLPCVSRVVDGYISIVNSSLVNIS